VFVIIQFMRGRGLEGIDTLLRFLALNLDWLAAVLISILQRALGLRVVWGLFLSRSPRWAPSSGHDLPQTLPSVHFRKIGRVTEWAAGITHWIGQVPGCIDPFFFLPDHAQRRIDVLTRAYRKELSRLLHPQAQASTPSHTAEGYFGCTPTRFL
jgi:hypothetical protein